jgi:uncharacterized coiled-coil protein SlyX
MKILNSKFDAKCKACGTFITAGDSVRWSKADGVSWTTCMACPHEPKAKGTTPAKGLPATGEIAATVAADLSRQLLAALDDCRALRARVGEMEATLAARAIEIARMSTLAHEARTERDELRAQLRNLAEGPLRFVDVPGTAPAVDDGDDLINVLAPGGVKACLAHDLAQIAAEKAAAQQADADDDCPI